MIMTMALVAAPVEAVVVQMEVRGALLKFTSMKTILISFLPPNGMSKVERPALLVITVNLGKEAEAETEERATSGEIDSSYHHVCDQTKQHTGESLLDMDITVL